ncbi:MAG: hypothetical protein AAF560_18405 [Acidobacteriota bacterium]
MSVAEGGFAGRPGGQGAKVLEFPGSGAGAAQRARMAAGLQQSVGNARLGRMLAEPPAADSRSHGDDIAQAQSSSAEDGAAHAEERESPSTPADLKEDVSLAEKGDSESADAKASEAGELSGLSRFLLERALKLVGIDPEVFYSFVGKSAQVLLGIIRKPGRFLLTLLAAVKTGFGQFASNMMQHLKTGFFEWIVGPIGEMGLSLPKTWDLKGIFTLVLGALGLNRQGVRKAVVAVLGERAGGGAFDFIMRYFDALMEDGIGGLWEQLKDDLSGLWTMVVDGIKGWLVTRVVQKAVLKIASMFNPVTGLVQVVLTAWDLFKFLRENVARIWGVVRAVVGGLPEIVRGASASVANLIEQQLAKLVPVAISLLAKLLGLGGLTKVVRKKIEAAQDFLLGLLKKLITKVKGLFKGKKKSADGPDPRSSKQKQNDLDLAMDQAERELIAPDATPESIAKQLPDIKEKHQLATLDLEVDGTEKYYVVGTINPRKKTESHRLNSGKYMLAPGTLAEHEGTEVVTLKGKTKTIHVLSRHGSKVTNEELRSRLDRDEMIDTFRRYKVKKLKGWAGGYEAASSQYARIFDREPDQAADPEGHALWEEKVAKLEHDMNENVRKTNWVQSIRETDRDEIRRFLTDEAKRPNLVFESSKFYRRDILLEAITQAIEAKQGSIDRQLDKGNGRVGTEARITHPLPDRYADSGIGFEFSPDMEIVPMEKMRNVFVAVVVSNSQSRHYKILTAYPTQ